MTPQSKFRPPGSLVEEAVRVITERIVRGDFPPGTRLVEERLARDFGISRPPIRESFRVLEREGLVTISPRRGVRVRQFTADEVRDIYLCRAVLRGLAARLASHHMTEARLKQLQRAASALERSGLSGEVAAYQQDVSRFNALVADFSGNLPLQELLHTLAVRAQLLSFTALSFPERLEGSMKLHLATADAICRGDAQTAELSAKQTLEDSIPYVVEHLHNQADESLPSSVEAVA
jgi:DNA-binding GntR family transcriptional regulator